MKPPIAIILAAGRGTRMKSDLPKVLHPILGKPIIGYILDVVRQSGTKDIFVVAGYGKEMVQDAVRPAKVIVQKRLLGSGDAVRSAKNILRRHRGDVLILCGDTPLITPATLRSIVEKQSRSGADVTILTAIVDDPASYGRITRDGNGRITGITEKIEIGNCDEEMREVNVGTYVFKASGLLRALAKIEPNKKKGELFLTDTIALMHKEGRRIESVIIKDEREMIGVNSRIDLACATKILKEKVLRSLMEEGVTIEDPDSTTIFPGVKIGRDSIIRPNTVIESDVEIGRKCRIGPCSRIRPHVRIGDDVEVGNFVELNRSKIGSGTRIKHHTYLGDAIVGRKVNIGAGTITANYDGKSKNKTIIEDGAFIGVGAILIAPVRVGSKATVGAGSVVPKNHDVPGGSIVVGVPARIYKKRKTSDRRGAKN